MMSECSADLVDIEDWCGVSKLPSVLRCALGPQMLALILIDIFLCLVFFWECCYLIGIKLSRGHACGTLFCGTIVLHILPWLSVLGDDLLILFSTCFGGRGCLFV